MPASATQGRNPTTAGGWDRVGAEVRVVGRERRAKPARTYEPSRHSAGWLMLLLVCALQPFAHSSIYTQALSNCYMRALLAAVGS